MSNNKRLIYLDQLLRKYSKNIAHMPIMISEGELCTKSNYCEYYKKMLQPVKITIPRKALENLPYCNPFFTASYDERRLKIIMSAKYNHPAMILDDITNMNEYLYEFNNNGSNIKTYDLKSHNNDVLSFCTDDQCMPLPLITMLIDFGFKTRCSMEHQNSDTFNIRSMFIRNFMNEICNHDIKQISHAILSESFKNDFKFMILDTPKFSKDDFSDAVDSDIINVCSLKITHNMYNSTHMLTPQKWICADRLLYPNTVTLLYKLSGLLSYNKFINKNRHDKLFSYVDSEEGGLNFAYNSNTEFTKHISIPAGIYHGNLNDMYGDIFMAGTTAERSGCIPLEEIVKLYEGLKFMNVSMKLL